MADAITDPVTLIEMLQLPVAFIEPALQAAKLFPLRAPLCYIERIEQGNPDDPLLRQILPLHLELGEQSGYTSDPLLENQAMPATGLLHKYPGRVLLVTTGACAIHCRYCFRRHFPYSDASATRQAWADALAYIRQNKSLSEVILSGGDPLTLSDQKLSELIAAVASVPHVKTLRIHTRLPIVLPDRITAGLLDIFHSTRLRVVVVVHCNHAKEIDQTVLSSLVELSDAGTTLLNQAVLMRGVNDSFTAQRALGEALFSARVLPYYLHMPDKVAGTAHFDLDEASAIKLIQQMRDGMPGYLVPRLVREIPRDQSKRIVA